MRRVLFISYHHPPKQTVGAHRIGGFVYYLPLFGWEAVMCHVPDKPLLIQRLLGVSTNQNLRAQVAEARAKFRVNGAVADKLASFYGEVLAYPDAMKGWGESICPVVQEYLLQNRVDAIVSSSPPVTCHVLANRLKDGRPWIADFRDLWTQNHAYPYSRVRRVREKQLERQTVAGADWLVTVSEPLAHKLGNFHGKPVEVIQCGFDPKTQIFDHLTERFTMTYTGNIYPKHYKVELLFKALSKVVRDNPQFADCADVRFYGAPQLLIDDLRHKYGLEGMVRQYGVVSHEEALARQRESHVLLMFKWDNKETGVYSAKLFEYLAAMRPIVAIGGQVDVVSDLLRETKAGSCCYGDLMLRAVLQRLFEGYRQFGHPAYYGVDSQISQYSQKEMARKMAGVLDAVCEKEGHAAPVSPETYQ